MNSGTRRSANGSLRPLSVYNNDWDSRAGNGKQYARQLVIGLFSQTEAILNRVA